MYTYTKRHRRFVDRGNEIFKAVFSHPTFKDYTSISDFYEGLAQRCENWCEERGSLCVSEKLRALSEGRSLVTPIYCFEAVVEAISERSLRIRFRVFIAQGKEKISPCAYEIHVWRLPEQLLEPPKASALKAACKSPVKRHSKK